MDEKRQVHSLRFLALRALTEEENLNDDAIKRIKNLLPKDLEAHEEFERGFYYQKCWYVRFVLRVNTLYLMRRGINTCVTEEVHEDYFRYESPVQTQNSEEIVHGKWYRDCRHGYASIEYDPRLLKQIAYFKQGYRHHDTEASLIFIHSNACTRLWYQKDKLCRENGPCRLSMGTGENYRYISLLFIHPKFPCTYTVHKKYVGSRLEASEHRFRFRDGIREEVLIEFTRVYDPHGSAMIQPFPESPVPPHWREIYGEGVAEIECELREEASRKQKQGASRKRKRE